jgi:hypothetical protein
VWRDALSFVTLDRVLLHGDGSVSSACRDEEILLDGKTLASTLTVSTEANPMNHLEQQDNSMDEDVAVCEQYLWNFVLTCEM